MTTTGRMSRSSVFRGWSRSSASSTMPSTSPRRVTALRLFTSVSRSVSILVVSDTASRGMANIMPFTWIISASMMARVRGSVRVNLLPLPTSVEMFTFPFKFLMLLRTTSMPTPRPEMSVTFSAEENPGAKIRSTASRSSRARASSGVIRPFLTAT